MEIILTITGIIAGIIIGWLLGIQKSNSANRNEREKDLLKYNELNKDYILVTAKLQAAMQTIEEKRSELTVKAEEVTRNTAELTLANRQLAVAFADNKALQEKLDTQKQQIDDLNKKFTTEFENIANRILETKTEKFTELNKNNLTAILEPLGKNLEEFKRTVNETYDKESKERFSLAEKVKELAQLNQEISQEAKNLTRALKTEVKTQGRWGEIILETILERSGLRKGEEYFMEHQLLDTEGNPLLSDGENKKMRPDAVVKYPDNRHVIIDSKVSLVAFTRFIEATEAEIQKAELEQHLAAVKSRITELSNKGYDDYNKALDFVMMFIPTEPAYMAAMQADPNLWNFAYERRILLVNPTSLITSLKLIVDLWKREYQNKNAQEIADRGAKLYDKFVGFVTNLEEVGKHIDKAKNVYDDSFRQLSTGKDNLVLQATKLKDLGVKIKKELPEHFTNGLAASSEVSI